MLDGDPCDASRERGPTGLASLGRETGGWLANRFGGSSRSGADRPRSTPGRGLGKPNERRLSTLMLAGELPQESARPAAPGKDAALIRGPDPVDPDPVEADRRGVEPAGPGRQVVHPALAAAP